MTPKTPSSSQLPDWMRDPEADAESVRPTLTWQMGQSVKRTWPYRKISGAYWKFHSRSRLTQRFPKTTAAIGVFLALGLAFACYWLINWLWLNG